MARRQAGYGYVDVRSELERKVGHLENELYCSSCFAKLC